MASVTIRNLDEQLKKRLKLQAAANNRSMEEEIRRILADSGQEAAETPSPRSFRPSALSTQSLPSLTESFQLAPPPSSFGPLSGRRITLVITGGIAAYKSLDLIRRLRERGAAVRVIMTRAAGEFVTPLAAGALAGGNVHTDLFDPRSEFDVGHIRLARDTDLIVVAPCTADFLARMVNGLAEDLAGAVLLATNCPVLIAPAMNPQMWKSKATQRNLFRARADGIHIIGPNAGEMAESGEAGTGRMSEPIEIADAVVALLSVTQPKILTGKRILVTAGPTHEPIDPVRYIANRSSGKQGYAIAKAAADAGAKVTLVSGPVNLADPPGVDVVRVESARDMLAAVDKALPVDVAIFAAAVADWRVASEGKQKIKKGATAIPPLQLTENPDILATISMRGLTRPKLVIGFAAETEKIIANAQAKLARKRCDWILANDVSAETGVMGGDRNTIHLVTAKGVEDWPEQSKEDVAGMLVERIAAEMA